MADKRVGSLFRLVKLAIITLCTVVVSLRTSKKIPMLAWLLVVVAYLVTVRFN